MHKLRMSVIKDALPVILPVLTELTTNEDWKKYRSAGECHICNQSLYKDLYLDSMEIFDSDSGKYCGKSHRRCYHQAAKNRYAPREIRKPKDAVDLWITINKETCLFCADPLLVPNFKDSLRDHDHMTGKYRGAAHNECNFKEARKGF